MNAFHTVLVTNPTNDNVSFFTVPVRYTNLSFIDAGAQGTVVSADDVASGRRVAIKKMEQPFISQKTAQRVFREFALLSSVKHPNIIRVLSVFTPQNSLETFQDVYIVMEFVKENLSEIIEKVRLDHKRLSKFIYQLLCAVNHLHRQGIIHRDLKPDNLVVNVQYLPTHVDLTLKVLDFGLARLNSSTQMSAYVATRYYRAPEIVLKLPYSYKVDVWSIGCIFAEMITNKVLLPGRDRNDQWTQIVKHMGSPSANFLSTMDPRVAQHISRMPHVTAKSLDEIIPDHLFAGEYPAYNWTAAHARRLISKMLAIDPNERCSIEEALQDPYVQYWRRDEEINANLSLVWYNRIFDQGDPAMALLKSAIFDEVKRIESFHNVF